MTKTGKSFGQQLKKATKDSKGKSNLSYSQKLVMDIQLWLLKKKLLKLARTGEDSMKSIQEFYFLGMFPSEFHQEKASIYLKIWFLENNLSYKSITIYDNDITFEGVNW